LRSSRLRISAARRLVKSSSRTVSGSLTQAAQRWDTGGSVIGPRSTSSVSEFASRGAGGPIAVPRGFRVRGASNG
jgi:hypothetical protein